LQGGHEASEDSHHGRIGILGRALKPGAKLRVKILKRDLSIERI